MPKIRSGPPRGDGRSGPPASAPPGARGEVLDAEFRLEAAGGRVLEAGDAAGAWLDGLFALRPAAWLRRVPGRETFAWPAGGGDVVVKRFLGDERRERWYERLRGRAPRSPGRREGENLAALAADGLPVPRALAWFEDAATGRSAVVMQHLDARAHLRGALDGPGRARGSDAARACAAQLAEIVAALHGAGWFHRDLYLVHVLLAPGPVLIDVGRARRERRPRRRWFVKDLAALHVSAPPGIGAASRLRFLRDYLRLRGLPGRAERRAWVRAVLAKARRLERHVPRLRDPRDGDRRYAPTPGPPRGS